MDGKGYLKVQAFKSRPPTGLPGKVMVAATKGNAPFSLGALLKALCVVAPGVTVSATDFTFENLKVYDANGAVFTWGGYLI